MPYNSKKKLGIKFNSLEQLSSNCYLQCLEAGAKCKYFRHLFNRPIQPLAVLT